MNITSRHIAGLALGACLLAAGSMPASAENLIDAYQQARQSDPVLAQAQAQDLIAEEDVAQARAQLLPQLSASYSYSRSRTHRRNTAPTEVSPGTFDVFTSRSANEGFGTNFQASLSQSLFDFGKYANLKSSHARSDAQDELFRAAQQNLIIRVSKAYFGVLGAEDQLNFAKAREKALAKQLDQAQQRYDVGLSAITDVNEAKANHDAATANVIQAQNALDDAREVLAQITGKAPRNLEVLREDLPMAPPSPDNQQAWVEQALQQNPRVLAQRHQLEAAEKGVTVARSARLPTLGASLNYSHSPSWGDDLYAAPGMPFHSNSDMENTSIGLTLTIPIFSGGATRSRVRQSIQRRELARYTLEEQKRQIKLTTRNAYRSVIAGISEVEARKQAVISANSALEATQAGYEVGTRNIIDVLNVQQQLFQARSAYSEARHQFILNKLLLKQSAGTISYDDLVAVNNLLVASDPIE